MTSNSHSSWKDILLSKHVIKMIESRNIQDQVMPILDLIKANPDYFFQYAHTLRMQNDDSRESYVLNVGKIRLIFTIDEETNNLILVTAMIHSAT